jgi:hypothetical protein
MYGRNDVSGSAHKNDITIFLSKYKISRITFHLFFHLVLASFGPLANSPSDSSGSSADSGGAEMDGSSSPETKQTKQISHE